MRGTRRSVAALALVALLGLVGGCAGAGSSTAQGGGADTTITDVMGRQVTVKAPAPRILLGGSRLLYTTALLDPQDPTAGIVGWPNDLKQNDPDTFNAYAAKFPRVASMPELGQLPNGSFSAEQAIDLKPDVFVVSAANFSAAQQAGTIDRLQQAGIPTVVVDYFQDPLKNTVPSVRLMGQLMGRQAQAQQYADWYRAGLNTVRSRIDAARPAATPTFLWRASGYYDCCATFARSNLASLVTYAGGDNIGDSLIPATAKQGTVSPETVLARAPAVVIGTGAHWQPGAGAAGTTFVPLGYENTPDKARAQVQALINGQPGFSELPAVRDRRVFVAWHQFYDSPYNVVAAQWFATWIHPELFRDLSPDATLRDLHQRFLPVPDTGAFWAGLP